jgi:hypothetical protein
MITEPFGPLVFSTAADTQDYHPAYVVTSFGYLDIPAFARLFSPTQWTGGKAFGISNLGPVEQRITSDVDPDSPSTRAFREIHPGVDPPADAEQWFYPMLIVMTALSQAPVLSDRSFVDAMRHVQIPPSAPGEPVVGYAPDRYTGINDAAAIVWNPEKKVFEFPEGATRHHLWP